MSPKGYTGACAVIFRTDSARGGGCCAAAEGVEGCDQLTALVFVSRSRDPLAFPLIWTGTVTSRRLQARQSLTAPSLSFVLYTMVLFMLQPFTNALFKGNSLENYKIV